MRQFLFAFALLSCLVVSAQNKIVVSDNPEYNAFIKGFSGYAESPTGKYLSVQIEKAKQVNGVYRNVVRLWYGRGNTDYINLVYNTYPTEEAAKADLKNVMGRESGLVYLNWDAIDVTSKSIDLTETNFCEKEIHAQKSKSARRAQNSVLKTNQEELSLNMTFEGLHLNSQGRLEGIDEGTGLNVSYYSEEKRLISLRGTPNKAWVEMAPAPRRGGTAVRFKSVEANERGSDGEKVRITGSISGLQAIKIINSVDIYLPKSWKVLTKQENGISWLTIQEYWCAGPGIPFEGEPQFRMTLGILKSEGKGNRLYFDLKAQDLKTTQQTDGSWKEKYTTLYELDDRKSKGFEIPFDRWFNLRTEIISGDSQTGHFRLVATDRRGKEVVIFDATCQTYATGYSMPGANRPFYRSVSPLKLYTSAKTLQYMRGKPLEIYYDNWNYTAVCIDTE